ncbi:MAG: hypothetical protein ACR2MK_01670 [Solirubrobacteraceae bacterium]
MRELYGLSYSPAQTAAFSAAVALVRAGRRTMPGELARGFNTRALELVASTERWRVHRGKPTPQVPTPGAAGGRNFAREA